eukprot:1357690-Alexandrium_andersonii.AAC.1
MTSSSPSACHPRCRPQAPGPSASAAEQRQQAARTGQVCSRRRPASEAGSDQRQPGPAGRQPSWPTGRAAAGTP